MPSGDQAGERSLAAGVLVRFRASPFSAGTVTISPRNSNAGPHAGRRDGGVADVLAPFTKRGRVSRRSAATPIASLRAVARPAGSSRCR